MSKFQFWAILTLITAGVGLALSCGSDKDDEDTSTSTKLEFTKDINPIIVASCTGSECHGKTGAGSTVYEEAEAAFVASKASTKSHLAANTMPKAPKTISAADEEKLVKFLDQ